MRLAFSACSGTQSFVSTMCTCTRPHSSNSEGKFTLDDLPDASKNIAHAAIRGEALEGNLLQQVVSKWKGAPRKEDEFK